jgi:antitoxin component YwqK of YwqJK toxin-antitoxin module
MKREKHTLLKKGDLWIDPDTMLPWSGIMFSTFKDSSVIEEWIPVQDGRVNGVWETFYPDSSPKTRIGFLNGVPHGIDEEFTKEGKPLRHAINENGKRSGVSTFWEYGGKEKLLKKYSKKDGVLHGEYEEYFEAGHSKEKGSYSFFCLLFLWACRSAQGQGRYTVRVRP